MCADDAPSDGSRRMSPEQSARRDTHRSKASATRGQSRLCAPALRKDARAAATYHPSMVVRETMKPGLRYLAIAAVTGGSGQGSVGL